MSVEINIIERDILNATDAVVAHCCNTRNTMNSGVAKALRNRFPEIYESDSAEYIRHGKNLLGMAIWVPVVNMPELTAIRFVVNLYGQPNYGYDGKRFVDYEALYQSLEMMKNHLVHDNYKSVALPYKLASDRAGGHWPIVMAMIEHIFDKTGITINLYKI